MKRFLFQVHSTLLVSAVRGDGGKANGEGEEE